MKPADRSPDDVPSHAERRAEVDRLAAHRGSLVPARGDIGAGQPNRTRSCVGVHAPDPAAKAPGWQRLQRELHVYVAALVQAFDDREIVLWNPGPILAWDEPQAVDRALKLLLRHREPIHVFPGSKPRLTVQRVNASES